MKTFISMIVCVLVLASCTVREFRHGYSFYDGILETAYTKKAGVTDTGAKDTQGINIKQKATFTTSKVMSNVELLKRLISKIVKGKTTELEVLRILGSPTLLSDYGERTFFYVQTRFIQRSFLKSKLMEQDILEISFDVRRVVHEIRVYSISDAVDVKFNKTRTKIVGKEMSVIEQFTRNIGKFNTPSGRKEAGRL